MHCFTRISARIGMGHRIDPLHVALINVIPRSTIWDTFAITPTVIGVEVTVRLRPAVCGRGPESITGFKGYLLSPHRI